MADLFSVALPRSGDAHRTGGRNVDVGFLEVFHGKVRSVFHLKNSISFCQLNKYSEIQELSRVSIADKFALSFTLFRELVKPFL